MGVIFYTLKSYLKGDLQIPSCLTRVKVEESLPLINGLGNSPSR